MPSKKKEDKIIAYDKTGINICGSFFDVNQDLPSADLMDKILNFSYIQTDIDRKIKNYANMIDIVEKEQSILIAGNENNVIEKFNELEKQKDVYTMKMSSIYKDTLENILIMIEWLIGKDAVQLILSKKIAFNEVVNILHEALKRNTEIKNKLNKNA